MTIKIKPIHAVNITTRILAQCNSAPAAPAAVRHAFKPGMDMHSKNIVVAAGSQEMLAQIEAELGVEKE